jgi:hypothetical protein
MAKLDLFGHTTILTSMHQHFSKQHNEPTLHEILAMSIFHIKTLDNSIVIVYN